MMEELVRPVDAARMLQVSESTVKAWLKKADVEPGQGLKSVTLPSGRRRIPLSAINRLFEERKR